MEENEQIRKYKKYIDEYTKENRGCDKDNIRYDLKLFIRKLKAAIKVALEDSIDKYGNEGIYMFTLAYLYEYDNSYFWNVISTEEQYEKLAKEAKENILMYYRYSPEESPYWDTGKEAFYDMNEEFVNMVENQEYDKENYDEDETFWDTFEFDDFYSELEKVCLHAMKEIRDEGFLETINLENITFQFYVRDHYSTEKEIEMFKYLNNGNDKAIEGFIKSY